jgi:cytochrome c-type biogenesis protein CcmE
MKRRHKRIGFIIAGLAGLGIAAALVLSAFQENLVFFFSPHKSWLKKRPSTKHSASAASSRLGPSSVTTTG